MSTDTGKGPSSIEQLIAMLKDMVSSDEPTEAQFTELGENLLTVVKTALSSSTN